MIWQYIKTNGMDIRAIHGVLPVTTPIGKEFAGNLRKGVLQPSINGVEMVTTPKTEKSERVIDLPKFLCDEMEEFFDSLYKADDNSRLFTVTKSYLHHEMDRGCKLAGVKRIRIHDLRHSSCALLIDLGYSPVQIAERLGHESITITEQYSHLYPSVQKQMAAKLDEAFREDENNG